MDHGYVLHLGAMQVGELGLAPLRIGKRMLGPYTRGANHDYSKSYIKE